MFGRIYHFQDTYLEGSKFDFCNLLTTFPLSLLSASRTLISPSTTLTDYLDNAYYVELCTRQPGKIKGNNTDPAAYISYLCQHSLTPSQGKILRIRGCQFVPDKRVPFCNIISLFLLKWHTFSPTAFHDNRAAITLGVRYHSHILNDFFASLTFISVSSSLLFALIGINSPSQEPGIS